MTMRNDTAPNIFEGLSEMLTRKKEAKSADFEEYDADMRRTVSQNLKIWRNERGISQAKLAEILGVTPGLIGMYETGKGRPSLKVLRDMHDILGLDITWLLTGEEVHLPEKYVQVLMPLTAFIGPQKLTPVTVYVAKEHESDDRAEYIYTPENFKKKFGDVEPESVGFEKEELHATFLDAFNEPIKEFVLESDKRYDQYKRGLITHNQYMNWLCDYMDDRGNIPTGWRAGSYYRSENYKTENE
jgi:transcriptional regulator with XRE-family HTH domain